MLFSEIYGCYFQAVSAILTEAVSGTLTDHRLTDLVHQKAFAESVLSIPTALKHGDWPLLDTQNQTPLHFSPTMPLTTLQKRWLKTLLQDPRIALFSPKLDGLSDVTPLYAPETFVFFDQYTDGDPYTEPQYIAHFQTILLAINTHHRLHICFHGHTGRSYCVECVPYRLEYSAKDDKFRLLTTGDRRIHAINLARITACTLLDSYDSLPTLQPQLRTLVLLLHDTRNALARVLLHFSHFEKETVRLSDTLYQITLRYDSADETELIIRVLSFGPMLEVTSPPNFRALLHARLLKQMQYSESD
ncbi:MAG: WYL domain-containing protein [Butyricicoccus pullicaecorum]|nr:WYL domain-containing protein [Butyricicoccus pullicaecorum]MDO4669040.1 WYL domain-containing protein [Butyricicoccus pullicaecorum]